MFTINNKKQPPEVFYKKAALTNSQYSQKTPMLDSFFNLVAGLQVCNFNKKRLQQSYFLCKLQNF